MISKIIKHIFTDFAFITSNLINIKKITEILAKTFFIEGNFW